MKVARRYVTERLVCIVKNDPPKDEYLLLLRYLRASIPSRYLRLGAALITGLAVLISAGTDLLLR